jgi:hypothetical protein
MTWPPISSIWTDRTLFEKRIRHAERRGQLPPVVQNEQKSGSFASLHRKSPLPVIPRSVTWAFGPARARRSCYVGLRARCSTPSCPCKAFDPPIDIKISPTCHSELCRNSTRNLCGINNIAQTLSSSFCLSWAAERLWMLGMTGGGESKRRKCDQSHTGELASFVKINLVVGFEH